MRIQLTLCIAARLSGEDESLFFLRANRNRDDLVDANAKFGQGHVAVSTFMKMGGSSASVEFDLKGPAKFLSSYTSAVIHAANKMLDSDAPLPKSTRTIVSGEQRDEKAIVEVATDDD